MYKPTWKSSCPKVGLTRLGVILEVADSSLKNDVPDEVPGAEGGDKEGAGNEDVAPEEEVEKSGLEEWIAAAVALEVPSIFNDISPTL